MEGTPFSLSDIASVVHDDGHDGLGGGNALVLIILFALIFGMGGFGMNKTTDVGQFATAASQSEILFGQQFQSLDNKIDRIGNGICDSTYALNNSIMNAQMNLGNSVNTEGRALQMQMANCCCENLRNTDTLATAIHAEGEQTRAMIQQNKIETLQSKVNNLEMINAISSATAGVVKYPNATTYSAGNSCFGNSCGCNII